jgi:hypothetical protein
MAFLAAKAFDFSHGQALHADERQSLSDLLQLEGLDDGGNHSHKTSLRSEAAGR